MGVAPDHDGVRAVVCDDGERGQGDGTPPQRGDRCLAALEQAPEVRRCAGITRDTLRKIENGDPTAGFGNVAQVLRALGVFDQVVGAVDPLNSDIGRLRAGSLANKRGR
ncbi:transcriptional regulator [Microbacterium sp.]|uniref:transcriptional regulator n=1 Tax=Microbacterium sp. TaxID=51671 RepID=UPI0039E715D7